ncbi:flagellar hook-length control protein FliK [Hylemonella gracilis]|nr:flagellar hook-length control protein FliK [Hylemonella gracilis]
MPAQPQSVVPTRATASLDLAQARMADADGEAASAAPDLDQFLLQRVFQGQGLGGDIWVLAQAWRHLVLARLRQVQGLAFAPTPPGAGRPAAAADAAAMAASLALLQAMTPDETRQDDGLHSALWGPTAQASNPALLLPQLWMFHTYVWNNTLPLTFWVLPREEEKMEGGQAARQPTRARMLRLCFKHPVHGPLWVDVRVDEQQVTVDFHAEQADAVATLLQLRPAVSAALAQAGLHLLRYQVRAGSPPRPEGNAAPADSANPALPTPGMNSLPSLLNSAESTLAPELFLATVGVMEALRTG